MSYLHNSAEHFWVTTATAPMRKGLLGLLSPRMMRTRWSPPERPAADTAAQAPSSQPPPRFLRPAPSRSPLFSSGLLVGILVKWVLNHAGDHQWFPVPMPDCSHQIAVHLADELEGYFLRTHHCTLAVIRATAEAFVRHRGHHAESPLVALGLTLRKRIEVGEFGGGKKHSGCIRACLLYTSPSPRDS